MTLLHPGDKFPALTVALPGGDSLQLPEALNGHYGVVLFYRGSCVPTATPSAFERAGERLTDMDAQIVALSANDEPATVKLLAKHDLEFPVGHSADTAAQSTGFVLDPGGRVVVSV